MKTDFMSYKWHCLELLIWVMRKSGAETPYFASPSFPTWEILLNDSVELLNVHGVNEIGQAETQTEEPLVPEPSVFEVELAIEKLKNHKSPNTSRID